MRLIFCLLCAALALTACRGEETTVQKEVQKDAQKKQTEKPADDPTQKAMKEGY